MAKLTTRASDIENGCLMIMSPRGLVVLPPYPAVNGVPLTPAQMKAYAVWEAHHGEKEQAGWTDHHGEKEPER